MIAALQVFVRGFGKKAHGERIVGVLERYGFTVIYCFGGSSDDRGGLIETDIRDASDLSGKDDLEALQEVVFAVSPPGTFLQYRHYRLDDEGEIHGPKAGIHDEQGQ